MLSFAIPPPVLGFSLVGPIFLAAIAAAAGGLFMQRAYLLLQLVRMGKPANRFDDLPKRVEMEGTVVLGQRKLLQRLGPGLMHAFIFWGFVILLTTIVEAIGEIFTRTFAIPLVGRTAWLGLIQDIFAILVLIGVEMAVFIRKVQRPERFKGSHLEEADFILLMIMGIIVTLLGLNATRISLGINESPASWTPLSTLISKAFNVMPHGTVSTFESVFLWAHVVLIFGFLAYIPHSKHLHIFASEPNVFFTKTKPRGKLEKLDIDMEKLEQGDVRLGAAHVDDLTWKEILDTYSCTECGRCQNVCPAWSTGKPLSPKLLIMNLRDQVFDEGPAIVKARQTGVLQRLLLASPKEMLSRVFRRASGDGEPDRTPLNPNVVEDEVIWDCVTCGACMQECPVNIEHVDHIVDLTESLGGSPSPARRLGGGTGGARPGGRPGARVPLLGGLRWVLR